MVQFIVNTLNGPLEPALFSSPSVMNNIIAAVKNALSQLQVQGYLSTDYSQYLYAGDMNSLTAESNLCPLVVPQMIPVQYYSQFTTAITSAYNVAFGGNIRLDRLKLLSKTSRLFPALYLLVFFCQKHNTINEL